MVNRQLIDPQSIVVVGASNNIKKPGGKLFYNIRTGTFRGKLYAINPDGTEKWNFPTNGAVHSSPTIYSNGTIYFGVPDTPIPYGLLYALNPDGTEIWSFPTIRLGSLRNCRTFRVPSRPRGGMVSWLVRLVGPPPRPRRLLES